MPQAPTTVCGVLYTGFVRFFFSVLVCSVISVIVFFALARFNIFITGFWKHLYWIIPLIWGILGIFWYDNLLDILFREE